MRNVGIDRPHIRIINGYWWCAIRGVMGSGFGYSPLLAYRDWDEWIYKKQVGHNFRAKNGQN